MEEKLYQNIDLPQNNPLDIKEEIIQPKDKKALNPKILLLIILGSFIFILLIISLIVTSLRQNNSHSASTLTPTSAPQANPTINESLVPSPFQESFKNLEQSLTSDPDLPAPQIDTSVGL